MKSPLLYFLLLFSLLLPKAYGQLTIDAETGLAFQDYNHVRIPNEGGTLFHFNKDFKVKGPVIPVRIRLGYTFKEKNHIYILWAPLGINYEGNAPRAIQFQNSQFGEGDVIEGFYKFNSYRLTYRRDILQTNRWIIGLGFTAKIRDASVQLENGAGLTDRKDDVGFVPLLHLYADYRLGNAKLYFEGDGLAGGPGRAFDLFLGTRIPISDKLAIKAGYRMLEGGANVDEVYNFTLVHFAVLGCYITL